MKNKIPLWVRKIKKCPQKRYGFSQKSEKPKNVLKKR